MHKPLSRPQHPWIFTRSAILLLLLTLLNCNLSAAVRTWDAGGVGANWTDATNWVSNIAPVSGDHLTFPTGTTKPALTNDFPAFTDFGIITIGNSFYITGNAIDLTNSVNLTGNLINPVVDLALRQAKACTFSVTNVSSSLTLDGSLALGTFAATFLSSNRITVAEITGTGTNAQVIKNGSGTLNLPGTNTYLGDTIVNAGTLKVNGVVQSNVVLNSNSTLGGTGTVGKITSSGSSQINITPGDNGPGILKVAGATALNSNTELIIQLNGNTAGTEYDQLRCAGTINLGSAALTVVRHAEFEPALNKVFVIVTNAATFSITGQFIGLPSGATVTFDGVTYQVSYTGGSGNDVTLTVTALSAPLTTRTWDGGGANRLWMNATNWAGDVAPVVTNSLRFLRNTANSICTNNYPTDTLFNQLRFSGSLVTNSYPLLRGTGIKLLSGIEATGLSGGGVVAIEMPIKLAATQIFTNDSTNTIIELRSNLVVAPFSLTLKGQGSFRTTGNVTATNNDNLIYINSGLIVGGSITGNVLLSSGGELSGDGRILGTLTSSGGTLEPGDQGPGSLLVGGNVSLFTSTVRFELTNAPGTGFDRLVISNGNLNLSFTALDLFAPITTKEVVGTTFTIIELTAASNSITGTFTGLPEGSETVAGPLRVRISYVGGTGNDVTLTIVGVVPTDISRTGFTAANQGDTLTFTAFATTISFVTNTFPADLSFDQLVLRDATASGGVGGMHIAGNSLRLENGIFGSPQAGQNDSCSYFLDLSIALNASQTFTNNFKSGMSLHDLDLNGYALTFEGTNAEGSAGFIIDGLVSGSGPGITKNGPKTLFIQPDNGVATYSGPTVVNGGFVRLNGSFASAFTLNPGTTLDAKGSVASITANGATVAPLTNLLSIGPINLSSSSTLELVVNSPTTNADRLTGNSTINLGGATLDLNMPTTALQDTNYILVSKTSAGPITGIFNGKPEGAEFVHNNRFYRISYMGGDGNDVVLTSTNRTPVFSPVPNQTTVEQSLFTLDINATDADPATTLAFTLDPGTPTNTSIDGSSGDISWTPTDDQGPGVHTIFVRVTDNGNPAKSATMNFQVTVQETNLPPVLKVPAGVTNNELAQMTFFVSGSDPDSPPSDLSFALVQAPSGMTINSNSSTNAAVQWTPTESQGPSTNIVLVRVTEVAGGLTSTQAVTVVAREVNTRPTLQPHPLLKVYVGDLVEQEMIASDTDIPANPLTLNLVSPQGGSVIVSNRLFRWTPTASQVGVRLIRVQCIDSSPEAVNGSLSVTVTNTIEVGMLRVVTNTADSGPGSLRQAILDINTNQVGGVIRFNIPGTGPHKIAPLTDFGLIQRPAIIDGYTQPGSRPNELTNGTDAIISIEISGENTPSGHGLSWGGLGGGQPVTIRGLCINSFTNGYGLASGCGSCGGWATAGSVIEGCFIGTDTTGTNARPNSEGIIYVQTFGSRIGGPLISQRNLISGNLQRGIVPVQGFDGQNVFALTIQNNLVGTDRTGTNALGNGGSGIAAPTGGNGGVGFNAHSCLIADNVFAANGSFGVEFGGTGNVIVRNKIGVGADGTTPLGNRDIGLRLFGNAHIVGGTNATNANIIAYNSGPGIHVVDGAGHSILGNSIFNNAGIAIDLQSLGNTTNDVGDTDIGANNLQNYPVITSVIPQPGLLTVSASFNSSNSTTYRIEFFHSDRSFDAARFLGFTNVTTDGSGNVSFSLSFPGNFEAGFVSATATDTSNSTSEISPGVPGAKLDFLRVGSQVRVLWKQYLTNFVLQTNPQVENTNGWNSVLGTPPNDGTNFFRDFAPGNSKLFFRLRSN